MNKFEKINILPNDRATWRIHNGFGIIPGECLGFFKWTHGEKISADMPLLNAIEEANNYAQELNLIEILNYGSRGANTYYSETTMGKRFLKLNNSHP